MRIVVTGATQFVGSHIVDEMARHDVDVVALVGAGEDASRLAGLDVEVVEADIGSIDSVRPALAEASFVIHAAHLDAPGHSMDEYEAVNVGGTTNILDACLDADVEGVIYLSSTAMYGDALPHWPVDEGWAFRPANAMEQSRAVAERAARTYRRRIPLIVLRPSLLFGARDRGVVYQLLAHFRRNSRPRLIGGGRAPVSLTYAPDLARVVWSVLDELEESKDTIFHVKTIDTDWATVLEELQGILHRPLRSSSLPYRLAVVAEKIGGERPWLTGRPAGFSRYIELVGRPHLVDDSRLLAATGFSPLFGLRAALRQTIEWMDRHPVSR
jgi:nucleoside-diphosphate-sugar epimerase